MRTEHVCLSKALSKDFLKWADTLCLACLGCDPRGGCRLVSSELVPPFSFAWLSQDLKQNEHKSRDAPCQSHEEVESVRFFLFQSQAQRVIRCCQEPDSTPYPLDLISSEPHFMISN